MAALSADYNYQSEGGKNVRQSGVAAASLTIYKGAILAWNASGLLTNAADTANFKSAGIALKAYTTASGSADRIEFETGKVWIAAGSLAQGDVGKLFYPDASGSVLATATNITALGRIVDFKTGYVCVDTSARA